MNHFEHDDILNGRLNIYNSPFFHMYLDGESPISNEGPEEVSVRDYASFIHEYIHYIQQITTPYGIKYNSYFIYSLILFRSHIDSNEKISIPVILEDSIKQAEELKEELRKKNGNRDFLKGNIDEIEINQEDIIYAKENQTAVNISVYDFSNDRAFEKGFQFGYTCVMESMAHLIQSLINPELYHSEVPYKSAEIVCRKIRPELKDDTKLLISICYTALFFDNPGPAFFEILLDVQKGENGIEVFERYMRDYPRIFKGEEMPNYRMMHLLMDDFSKHLQALLGNELKYFKKVIENCKLESSSGKSLLLTLIYNEDLTKFETLNSLLLYYGYPAIDSKERDIVVPFDPESQPPYLETASLVSLELIYDRFTKTKNDTLCIRYPICDRISRANSENLINEFCAQEQWKKKLPCLFTAGLHYLKLQDKIA